MDDEVKANPRERRWLSLLPSEYFRRQCWISFEPDDPTLPRLADLIGPDRIAYARRGEGSRAPHRTTDSPSSSTGTGTTRAPAARSTAPVGG